MIKIAGDRGVGGDANRKVAGIAVELGGSTTSRQSGNDVIRRYESD